MSTLPNLRDDVRDKAGHGRRVSHVESFGEDLRAVLLADFFRASVQRLFIASAHGDAASFGGEGLRRGQTYSLTGCGNQRDTTFESEIHSWAIS